MPKKTVGSRIAGVNPGANLGPFAFGGDVYFADAVDGLDGNDGKSPETAVKSIEVGYGKLRDGENDVQVLIGTATAFNVTAAFTWSKSFAHLVGGTGDLPGEGQRARVVGTTTVDPAVLFTLSGNGCVVKNIKFAQESDSASALCCVLVSGGRNYFENCMIAGMLHATPAADAAAYSLKITNEENHFKNCTIGADTIVRSAANTELWVASHRNSFDRCFFASNSVTSGKFLVKIDNTGGDLRYTRFRDCTFYNYTTNYATGITDAFDMPASGSTHYVLLEGNCLFVGVGMGVADTVTRVYGAGAAANAGMFVATNPTT